MDIDETVLNNIPFQARAIIKGEGYPNGWIEWMLEDCRQAPLSIFLTLPSTIPATNDTLETAGGSLDAIKASNLYDKWPEIIGVGETGLDFFYNHSEKKDQITSSISICYLP